MAVSGPGQGPRTGYDWLPPLLGHRARGTDQLSLAGWRGSTPGVLQMGREPGCALRGRCNSPQTWAWPARCFQARPCWHHLASARHPKAQGELLCTLDETDRPRVSAVILAVLWGLLSFLSLRFLSKQTMPCDPALLHQTVPMTQHSVCQRCELQVCRATSLPDQELSSSPPYTCTPSAVGARSCSQ